MADIAFPAPAAWFPPWMVPWQYFLANGVAPAKLGIGIAFYGYLWTGGSGTSPTCITQPRQSWTNAPAIKAYRYTDIMADYYQSNLYHWDASAQSAYLGITNIIPTSNIFLSYDDQRTCQAKVSYARNHGLGGVMIWELAQDHTPNQMDPLLQAVKAAVATPGQCYLQPNGLDMNLSFNSIALGSYRVEWSTDLTPGALEYAAGHECSGSGRTHTSHRSWCGDKPNRSFLPDPNAAVTCTLMKTKIIANILLFLTVVVFAGNVEGPAVIPLPQKMARQDGVFEFSAGTRIYVDSGSRATANFLKDQLRKSTGYPLKISVKSFGSAAIPGGILLTTKNADTNLGPEGYELTVTTNSVVIRAPAQAGLFYGVQTLLQLLPPEIFSSNRVDHVNWQIPCVQIEDWPRFKWRGFMLDVSRHFFTKAEVETLLDAMAMHKMNVFHWHLTDDHGWRIEIKKYPKLTGIGAWRPGVGFGFATNSTTAYGPDGRYGGFYTQDDIRDVVKYAAARHITIVPEIEMPGHSTAALAAYPQYSCTGGPFEPATTAGIFNGIYDPAKEETFQFLADVIAEVAPLFPGKYIHIGGDEVPKETWKNSADCQALMKREGLKNEEELQSWFIRRIEKIVECKRTLDDRLERNFAGRPRPKCRRHGLDRRREGGDGRRSRRGDDAHRLLLFRFLSVEQSCYRAEGRHLGWSADVEQNVCLRPHAHECAAGSATAYPRRPGQFVDGTNPQSQTCGIHDLPTRLRPRGSHLVSPRFAQLGGFHAPVANPSPAAGRTEH